MSIYIKGVKSIFAAKVHYKNEKLKDGIVYFYGDSLLFFYCESYPFWITLFQKRRGKFSVLLFLY